jgi:hypothetical protein
MTARRETAAHAEAGYALVALLALMTLMMLAVMTAAPPVRQQARREMEVEAIARGEAVAEAIRLYVRYTNGVLPSSIEQLLEGLPHGTRRLYILRQSAARDPLTASGEWQLVGPDDPELLTFARAVTAYAGGVGPPTREPILQNLAAQAASPYRATAFQTAPGGAAMPTASGARSFIGVASRSRQHSIIHYYGIDRHDRWVFTPLFR